MRRLRGSGDWIGARLAAEVCELPVKGYDGIQGVMDSDVRHDVSAIALERAELILGICYFVDNPVPCHSQRGIDAPHLRQCAVLLPLRLVLLLLLCDNRQRSGHCQSKEHVELHQYLH